MLQTLFIKYYNYLIINRLYNKQAKPIPFKKQLKQLKLKRPVIQIHSQISVSVRKKVTIQLETFFKYTYNYLIFNTINI